MHAKDGLPVGAPPAVAERAGALPDAVEVLLLDHVRSSWRASGLPSPDGPRLARAGRAGESLALDDRAGCSASPRCSATAPCAPASGGPTNGS